MYTAVRNSTIKGICEKKSRLQLDGFWVVLTTFVMINLAIIPEIAQHLILLWLIIYDYRMVFV